MCTSARQSFILPGPSDRALGLCYLSAVASLQLFCACRGLGHLLLGTTLDRLDSHAGINRSRARYCTLRGPPAPLCLLPACRLLKLTSSALDVPSSATKETHAHLAIHISRYKTESHNLRPAATNTATATLSTTLLLVLAAQPFVPVKT